MKNKILTGIGILTLFSSGPVYSQETKSFEVPGWYDACFIRDHANMQCMTDRNVDLREHGKLTNSLIQKNFEGGIKYFISDVVSFVDAFDKPYRRIALNDGRVGKRDSKIEGKEYGAVKAISEFINSRCQGLEFCKQENLNDGFFSMRADALNARSRGDNEGDLFKKVMSEKLNKDGVLSKEDDFNNDNKIDKKDYVYWKKH